MTIKGGFFESKLIGGVQDRAYSASEYAERWGRFVSNGISVIGGGELSTENEVTIITDTMTTQVAVGSGYINGYAYEVEDPEIATHAAADPTNPRIDRVVIELNLEEATRAFVVKTVTGTPAASPSPPSLTRTATVWQISLAQVLVPANVVVLNTGTVTDERSDEAVCGVANVKLGIEPPDQALVNEVVDARTSEKNGVFADLKERLDYGEDFDNAAFFADLLAYWGNTKLGDSFQDISLYTISGTATKTADETNVKIENQSMRITETDNSSGLILASANNFSRDFTTLNNGEASTDDDFILVFVYITDVADFISAFLQFGADSVFSSANKKSVDLLPLMSNGWNWLAIPKSDFTTDGTGSWDFNSIRLTANTQANAQNAYISYQLIQLIKADPETPSIPSALQNNGARDFDNAGAELFVGYEFGKLTIKRIDQSSLFPALIGKKQYKNPTLYFETRLVNPSASPTLMYYIDASNWVETFISGSLMYINTRVSGVNNLVSTTFTLGTAGDTLQMKLQKNEDIFAATITNEETGESKQLKATQSYASEGFLAIGTQNANAYVDVASATEIPHAYHSDISEVSKSVEGSVSLNNEILSVDWVDDTGTSGYWYYDVSLAITDKDIPGFAVHLDDKTKASALTNDIESKNGYVRLYAFSEPTEDFTIDIWVVK